MSADARYFELNDDVGIEPELIPDGDGGSKKNPKAGELQPIQEVGVVAAVPRMEGKELVEDVVRVTVKAIPGTRILKVDEPAIAQAIQESGQYHEIEAPSEKDLKSARKDTESAREGGKGA